jgi:hypothetical protein
MNRSARAANELVVDYESLLPYQGRTAILRNFQGENCQLVGAIFAWDSRVADAMRRRMWGQTGRPLFFVKKLGSVPSVPEFVVPEFVAFSTSDSS